MAAVADSGAIYGLYNRRDRYHRALRKVLDDERGEIVITAAILSEVDYLLGAKIGISAELDLLDDILQSAFTLEDFTTADAKRTRELIAQYSDLNLGLADAAVVATAERRCIDRILTVDERHFRVIRSINGKPFTLLPADFRRAPR